MVIGRGRGFSRVDKVEFVHVFLAKGVKNKLIYIQEKELTTKMSLIWLTSFMEVKGGGGLSWEDDLRKVSSDWNRATTFLQHPNGSRLNFQKNSHFFQTNSSFSCNDLLIDQMYTYNHDSNSLIQYIASLISPKLLCF